MPHVATHFFSTPAPPPVGHRPRLRRASVNDRAAATAARASASEYRGGTNVCLSIRRTEPELGSQESNPGLSDQNRPCIPATPLPSGPAESYGATPSTTTSSDSAARCLMRASDRYSSDSYHARAASPSGNSKTTRRAGDHSPSSTSAAPPRTRKRPP